MTLATTTIEVVFTPIPIIVLSAAVARGAWSDRRPATRVNLKPGSSATGEAVPSELAILLLRYEQVAARTLHWKSLKMSSVRLTSERASGIASRWVAVVVSIVVIVLFALTLGACGGGSSSTTSSTAASGVTTPASAHTSSSGANATLSVAGHTATAPPSSAARSSGTKKLRRLFAAYAACLGHNGVTLHPGSGTGIGAELGLRKLDTGTPAYRAAVAKCRGVLATAPGRSATAAPGGARPSGSVSSQIKPAHTPAAVTAVLKRFTACMRASGVPEFPEPEGAGFHLKGTRLNPSSKQYKQAEAHCDAILQALDAHGTL